MNESHDIRRNVVPLKSRPENRLDRATLFLFVHLAISISNGLVGEKIFDGFEVKFSSCHKIGDFQAPFSRNWSHVMGWFSPRT
jgi:hypothetical protein